MNTKFTITVSADTKDITDAEVLAATIVNQGKANLTYHRKISDAKVVIERVQVSNIDNL